ncbi:MULTISPECIES: DUF3153 domain-containing protein [Paenibacillus]|uniref:DUF3153 domain-containing protein n=1 Tax=Paenibacillus borealis TaxID=160799 RepID=A0ABX3H128_PAEBO|nr:DUF3153 domain-containing protein [Paenibacillus borealis]OMD43149.1 hypothetical protein BSK56_24585 [Paenibacillus borealis]
MNLRQQQQSMLPSLGRRRRYFVVLMISMLVLLTGCASGTAHMTVKKDGSLELAFSILLDSRAEAMVGGKLEDVLTTRLEAAGIELKKSQNGKSTEYQFLKAYASLQDLQANAGKLDIVDAQVEQVNNWLYTKYDVVAQPKLNAYSDEIIDGIGSLSVPKSLVRMLLQNLAVDFKLTLPYDLYGANNAAEQDGNTLTWHITMADSQPLEMVVYVPNVRNIAIAGGGVVLILAVAIIWFIRARKARKPKSA